MQASSAGQLAQSGTTSHASTGAQPPVQQPPIGSTLGSMPSSHSGSLILHSGPTSVGSQGTSAISQLPSSQIADEPPNAVQAV